MEKVTENALINNFNAVTDVVTTRVVTHVEIKPEMVWFFEYIIKSVLFETDKYDKQIDKIRELQKTLRETNKIDISKFRNLMRLLKTRIEHCKVEKESIVTGEYEKIKSHTFTLEGYPEFSGYYLESEEKYADGSCVDTHNEATQELQEAVYSDMLSCLVEINDSLE